ncbi:MAG: DUF4288 domain-containing protein [Clostridia bacterium]|nr:DUF4288 domain-containing protein [Clostridia bacterium]
MKYSVKLLVRYTVETGEVFLEESILMLEAASFDDAYSKAEKYVEEDGLFEYDNLFGKKVRKQVISYVDCFRVYDDPDDVLEVYSTIRRSSEQLPENVIVSVLENSCTRAEMLPLRQWADPDDPEELELIERGITASESNR